MTSEKTSIKINSQKEGSTAFAWFYATSVNGGVMCMGAVVASYFSVYMTDTLKLLAASASLIMLIALLWDAFNDPMMGVIADRTKTKWGRYRPYFLLAPVLIMLFGTLIWVNPGLSGSALFAYVLLTYIGWGMTTTMYTMPQMAVLPIAEMKKNMEESEEIE